jgi:NAD(P)-dependent dehydrogenase (short-subunit alcohol dehydrogenase family)
MTRLNELIDLSGRTSLVTGAAGGLGQVFCHTLAELNSNLILIDRNSEDLMYLEKDLQKLYGIEVEAHIVNLENQHSRTDLCESVMKSNRGLDILVNNAAFVGSNNLEGWKEEFERQSTDTWRRAIEVNLTAVFDLCRDLSPKIRESKHGSIINIASIYGSYGPDWRIYDGTGMGNPAAYAASKGGLLQLTRWLSTTLAPSVRVNAIASGGIFRGQPEEFVNRYSSKVPMGRMATEDDLRGALAFLASDLSAYVTGQVLFVDGGWGIW